ncbi:endonuclease/exonuclease/phosphatase family protein [Enterococcus faecium]|uniref:endonuclease/exonuclease/phosphatase family protein n=1 Tax=Enterococcus faecium TaxID=1352 RepID=UPI0029533530|nr:endonuclease/exonuclease/phosphatase family protein [Enterococcus faecium]MDV7721125.1 endonuclease/exonuclease/phosphatase family protein [Enterococcus faecium]MDV7858737.1 endonuclease/exonuclease/phosphatase family protein [Enterococcus faecium]
MKFMTLNTHSWLEPEPEKKLQELADKILLEDYEVIALQEINQLLESEEVEPAKLMKFCLVKNQVPIRKDNFAYRLVQLLKEHGKEYFWSWEMSHIGYDKYEEGNALLTKKTLESQVLTVSQSQKKEDYQTRKILIGKTKIDDQDIFVSSCHFSWWTDKKSGFYFEWKNLENYFLETRVPLFFLGDFNNPVDSQGYYTVRESCLLLQDSYVVANEKGKAATVEKKIDGWEQNTEKLRIDFIFVPEGMQVKKYQRIFDGIDSPIISDHYGVEIELDVNE